MQHVFKYCKFILFYNKCKEALVKLVETDYPGNMTLCFCENFVNVCQ